MKRYLLTIALVAALAATAAGPAGAGRARDTWATVNICDTRAYPDTLGLRAEAPGNGTRQQIWMRFRAEYYDTGRAQWRRVKGKGTSPFFRAGSARFRTRQQGYSFRLEPTVRRTTYRLRGKAQIEYRERRRDGRIRVVRRLTRKTTAGRDPDFADPKGYSEARCTIRVCALPARASANPQAPPQAR